MKRPSLLLLFCLLPLGAFAQDPWEARIARAAAPWDHQVSWPTRVCYDYQVEMSPDLAQWAELGSVEAGTGSTITYKLLSDGADRLFYRVRETPDLPAYVVYVKVGGTGSGTSWADPRGSIQVAVALAAAHPGAEVWVAEGVYIENVTLAPGVGVYGGFAGDETVRCDREPDSHETVIDGNGSTVVTAPGDVDRSSVLDGFTIRNGSYGVDCAPGASPVIANNRITDNPAGGIYCEGTAASDGPEIRDNEITGNVSLNGGGILCIGCNALIHGNTITANVAEGTIGGEQSGRGGGICCLAGSTGLGPVVSGNSIRLNEATWTGSPFPPAGNGGGLYAEGLTGLRIVNNFISENAAQSRGDGLFCRDLTSSSIKSNWIARNDGDGIYCQAPFADALLIANNTIIQHTAGGAMPSGIFCNGDVPLEIVNNIIASNDYGIYVLGSLYPTIDHNCVWGNGTNQDYEPDSLPRTNPIDDDPRLEADLIHISGDSPCLDAGTNWVVEEFDRDIDGQVRILGSSELIVDVGADEYWDGGFSLTIEADPDLQVVGLNSTVTATVIDPETGYPVADYEVCFTVTGGRIAEEPPPIPPTEICKHTDDQGQVSIPVTRDEPGTTTATAEIEQPEGGTSHQFVEIVFYVPSDWPMFMHDPQHTGLLEYDLSFNDVDLVLQWQTEADTPTTGRTRAFGLHHHPDPASYMFEHPYIDSSPVVYEGLVIVGTWVSGSYSDGAGSRGEIRCFEADSGNLLWTTSMRPVDSAPDEPICGIASTPCIASVWVDNEQKLRVYVGSVDGYLYCLDPLDNGSVKWAELTTNRNGVASKIIASPVVYDNGENDFVYVGNEAAMMYAFEAGEGDVVDGYPVVVPEEDLDHIVTSGGAPADPNMVGCSSPAVAMTTGGDYLVFGCDNEYLYSINLAGAPVLRKDDRPDKEQDQGPGYCIESSPTVVADEDGHAQAILVGQTKWNGMSFLRFSIGSSGELHRVDSLPLGDSQADQECRATAALRDNLAPSSAYVGVDTGKTFHKVGLGQSLAETVTAFEATEGAVVNYFVGSAAVTSGGLVFVGNDNHRLYVLDAEVADPDKWKKKEDPDNLYGVVCCSPALSTNVDGTGQLWLFITSRYNGGTLWAFTVHEDPS